MHPDYPQNQAAHPEIEITIDEIDALMKCYEGRVEMKRVLSEE